MNEWKCPACGFIAKDEKERRNHLKEIASDQEHIEKLRAQAKEQPKKGLPL